MEAINISENPKMAVAAILGFRNFTVLIKFSNFCCTWGYGVQIAAKYSNQCGTYQHFVKSKMAAAAILDFQNLAFFLLNFHFSGIPGDMRFKLQPNSQIHMEAINISANPRWRPPSWIFKILHF